jgi:Protein of unknown function (DUF2934)
MEPSQFTDADIQVCAYYIWEVRVASELDGSPESDWLMAIEQLTVHAEEYGLVA